MAKLPDWLLNQMNADASLIEDSPAFRRQESQQQRQNIQKATDEALGVIQDRTRQARAQTVMHQMGALDSMTPMPTPLAGPDAFFGDIPPEADTPMTPNVPSAADFNPAPPTPAPEPEDPAAEVMRIAEATGIPAQQVASMALLGKDIAALEEARPPAPAGNMDDPRMPRPLVPPPAGNADDPRMAAPMTLPGNMDDPRMPPPAPVGNMDDPRMPYR